MRDLCTREAPVVLLGAIVAVTLLVLAGCGDNDASDRYGYNEWLEQATGPGGEAPPGPEPDPEPEPLAITTAELPAATSGTPYSAGCLCTGGTAPYSWILTAGVLPPGLTMNADGCIAGTPTGEGTFTFTLEVQDSTGQTCSRTLSLRVEPAAKPPCVAGATAVYDPANLAFDHDQHSGTSACTTCHHAGMGSCSAAGCHQSEWVNGIPKRKEAMLWQCRSCHDPMAGQRTSCAFCHPLLKEL